MPTQVQDETIDRGQAAEILRRKLSFFETLSHDDVVLVETCIGRPREFPSGVLLPIDKQALATVVVSGWVGRLRLFADGRRQVVSTMIVGELVNPHVNPFMANAMVALTTAQVSDLTKLLEAMKQEPAKHRRLRRAFDLISCIEEVQLSEQVVRLGRRSAFERLAHWLLDLQQRLAMVGMCDGEHFHMPLTQEILSDVLGMSIVHVNRIVKQLREAKLIDLKSGMITILQPERLRVLTEFTPLPVVEGRTVARFDRNLQW